MRDPHLPAFLFSCAACGTHISDPDKGVGEPIAKGGGFSSMKLFCSSACADGTAVEAALLAMDEGDGESDPVDEEDADEDAGAGDEDE